MGKTKKLRLEARQARQSEREQCLPWVTERVPPCNETHSEWTGPTCAAAAALELAAQEPESEPQSRSGRAELPLCTLPLALRREQLHRYDTVTYPFAELIGELIRPSGFIGPLHQIHQSFEVQNWLAGVKKDNARAYTVRRNYVDKRYKSARAFLPKTRTGECYLRFLREVVRPAVYAGLGLEQKDGGCAILYQRDPNFRCHLPNTGHLLVHRHCDADYHHQQNEVNFWVPITRSFGNNTLWSESAPGKNDFHPFELEVGEMKQFWGNQCNHYTVANDTDHTRITIDFRVIPLPQYVALLHPFHNYSFM